VNLKSGCSPFAILNQLLQLFVGGAELFTTWQPEKEAPNGDPKKSSVTHTKDCL
jgi:hypothetical protein